MNFFYFFGLFLFATFSGHAVEVQSLPLHSIEAEHVKSENKQIYLEGSVIAVLDFGTVRCNKAIISMQSVAKEGSLSPTTIELEGAVSIHFSDGSSLCAHRGVIDCQQREGTFYASDTEKVVYETPSNEGGKKSRMRATSDFLKGKLAKKENGWLLDDVNAEGAVRIEYLPEKIRKNT